jgi:hypothetical protein
MSMDAHPPGGAMTAIPMPTTAPASARARGLVLDDLLDLPHERLAALYRGAPPPALARLSGDLRGRMLAVPAVPSAISALPCAWARTSAFPWRGKSFRPLAPGQGEGINRVVLDRFRLFRFETSVGPSLDDGEPAVLLDYDLPENPGLIRRIDDEVREIEPGLLLGQAWLRLRRRPRFVLWFALAVPGSGR